MDELQRSLWVEGCFLNVGHAEAARQLSNVYEVISGFIGLGNRNHILGQNGASNGKGGVNIMETAGAMSGSIRRRGSYMD